MAKRAQLLWLAAIACFAACGGGGGGGGNSAPSPPPTSTPVASAGATVLPQSSPSPAPSATPQLTAIPQALSLDGIGAGFAADVTIGEAGFSGTFDESDTCAGVAVVAAQSTHGPAAVFVVTGVAAGTCTATFTGVASTTIVVPIVVTQSAVQIDSRKRG